MANIYEIVAALPHERQEAVLTYAKELRDWGLGEQQALSEAYDEYYVAWCQDDEEFHRTQFDYSEEER